MSYVVFENDGVIGLTGITTFGVSAKVTDNPIGYFGTGLKYAVAIVQRLGGQMVLDAGEQRYEFDCRIKEFRGKEFNMLYMNDLQLPFTDELGKNWNAWQAFRELYCNALDEGGRVYVADTLPAPKAGKTIFYVKQPLVLDAYLNRSEIVLTSVPLYSNGKCELHRGSGKHVYYKGVRVMDLSEPTRYTVNLTGGCILTEDRTLSYGTYEVTNALNSIIRNSEDEDFIEEMVTVPQGWYEHALAFNGPGCSEAFLRVVTRLREEFSSTLNQSTLRYYSDHVRKNLKPNTNELSEEEQKMLNRSIEVLGFLGFDVSLYPIIVVDSLGEGILGQAEHRKILLSKRAFEMGERMLMGTVFEEYIHLNRNYVDCERPMQNFLIDTLMAFGERIMRLERAK